MADIDDIFFKGGRINQDVIEVNDAKEVKVMTEGIVGLGLH